MQRLFHLSTCKTCKNIIEELKTPQNLQLQDIKFESITQKQLEEMHRLAGSYEALFSKRSRKFRSMGLHEKELNEEDYKKLILEEYTFLKRPVLVYDEQIFIGNAKVQVEGAKKAIHS